MEDNSSGRLAIRVGHGGHAILARPLNGGYPSTDLKRAQALHQEGVAHARQDRWRPALRAFNEAVRLAPDQSGFNYCKGVDRKSVV